MTNHRVFPCKLLSLLACIVSFLPLPAQRPSIDDILQDTDPDNFFSLQAAMNDLYRFYPEVTGEKQWRRKEWWLEPRLYPDGKMRNIPLETLRGLEKYLGRYGDQRSTHGSWLFLGPNQWAAAPPPGGGNSGLGRINSIDIHPTNDQIIYAGTSSGGLWRTTNGGTSWSNLTSFLPTLAVADIEIDYNNPNVLYLLTGDGDHPTPNNPTSHVQSGSTSLGVLKSTDGGSTWYPTGFNFEYPGTIRPTKLLMHPTDPNIQFVGSLEGIYRTTNGWNTYTQVDSQAVNDIEFKPGTPNTMYASRWNGIIRSTSGGGPNSWQTITDPDFFVFTGGQRTELAVSADLPEVVYALAGGFTGYRAILQSLQSGASNTWTIQDTTSNTLFGGQAIYNMALVADPSDYTKLFGGMIGFARSSNQGLAGTWTGHYPGHPDIHDLVYRNGILYCAHDGGLWKSLNNGVNWTEIGQGISNTECYTVTGTPLNTNFYIIGAQDVGHLRRNNGTQIFTTIACCDGMISIIHPTDINTIYTAGQQGGVNKSTTGLPPFEWTGNPGSPGAWNTPYIMDPADPEIIFVGKDSIHRSNTGGGQGSWLYLGRPTTGNLNVLAQGTNNRNRLYASSSSMLFRTDQALGNGVATWASINSGLPMLFITGIALNPDDANEIYLTYSGFTGGQKVYRSLSGGNAGSWENITGSLPNVPVNCIVYHDDNSGLDRLYIGTDIGVFYRDNDLGDWIYFSNFLPTVSVSDLYINPANNTIAAGTYGRGLWRSDLYSSCPATYNFAGTHTGGTLYYSASGTISSTVVMPQDAGTEVHYHAGNYITLGDGFRAQGQAFFEGTIGPCPADVSEPLQQAPLPLSGRLVLTDSQRKALLDRED